MNGAESGRSTNALGDAIGSLLQAPARVAAGLVGALTSRGSYGSGCGCSGGYSAYGGGYGGGCEIPPPCWEPRRAGTCCLVLTPGSSATIRVHVENCDWTRRVVGITALGRMAAWITFSPTTLIVGPQERASFFVTLQLPTTVKQGQSFSGPLLIRGCADHAVRLEVSAAACADRVACDVMVRDCPDHIHHWYDHFYCPRPCQNIGGGRLVSNG